MKEKHSWLTKKILLIRQENIYWRGPIEVKTAKIGENMLKFWSKF